MGRKPSWPPNSAAEWIIGQNFRSWDRKPASNRHSILKVELLEDEASGEETLAITYPRRRDRSGSAQATTLVEGSSSTRKVRFENSGEPFKSALKKPSENDSEDTLVEAAEGEAEIPTENESSSINETDTSEERPLPKRKKNRRRRRSRRSKTSICLKKANSEESSVDTDAIPHPTCLCAECNKGRMIMKAVIKAEAKLRATEEKAKIKQEAEESDSSSSEADDTSEAEAETTDTETTDGQSTEEEAKLKRGKKTKRKKAKKKLATHIETEKTPGGGQSKTAPNKVAFKLPKYPKELQPKFIMPTRARVVQVEHTVESPSDPAPNAFFDNKKGITRVYHGPKWGNLKAELYGKPAGSPEIKADSGDSAPAPDPAPGLRPPPVVPMPPPWQTPYLPPYWIPPPPPGQPAFHWAKTAAAVPAPLHEDSLKEAAAKGLGLSDMAAPKAASAIPEWQAPTVKTSSPKSGSNKDGWNTSPLKEAIPNSPFDFTGFGGANRETFSRKSNQSGSKKSGSVDGRKHDKAKAGGGWRDNKNDDGLGTGAFATDSSNKNDGWKVPESNGDNAWGNHQNATWGNGEKGEDNSWGNNKTAEAWGNESKSGDNAWGNNQNTAWGNGSPNARSPRTAQKGDEANIPKAGSDSGSGLGQGVFGLPDGFPPGLGKGVAKMPGAMPDSSEKPSWGGGQW